MNNNNNKIYGIELKDIFLSKVLKRIEHFILLTGPAGSGKSTLCIRLANELIANGYKIIFFDTEKQFTPERQNLIIDKSKIEIYPAENEVLFFEDLAIKISQILSDYNTKEKLAFIWDGIAGTPIRAEFESLKSEIDLASQGIALMPRYLSFFTRSLIPVLSSYNIPLIATNQTRAKIQLNPYSGLPKTLYGEKFEMPGGYALKHNIFALLELIPKEKEDFGLWVKIRLLKSKIQMPYEIDYYLDYNYGFSEKLQIIKYALKNKIISASGGWYSWNNKKYREKDIFELFLNDKTEFEKLKSLVSEEFEKECLKPMIFSQDIIISSEE